MLLPVAASIAAKIGRIARSVIQVSLTTSDIHRFWSHVDKSGDCWLWTSQLRAGYGIFQVKIGGKWKTVSAHRVSYELSTGVPPDNKFVCHRCDTPACVNSEHLFLGSPQDNVDDMFAKGRRERRKPYQKKEFRKAIKLSYEQYLEIVEALKSPYRGQGSFLAKKYGVNHSMISHIKSGRFIPAAISVHE